MKDNEDEMISKLDGDVKIIPRSGRLMKLYKENTFPIYHFKKEPAIKI